MKQGLGMIHGAACDVGDPQHFQFMRVRNGNVNSVRIQCRIERMDGRIEVANGSRHFSGIFNFETMRRKFIDQLVRDRMDMLRNVLFRMASRDLEI